MESVLFPKRNRPLFIVTELDVARPAPLIYPTNVVLVLSRTRWMEYAGSRRWTSSIAPVTMLNYDSRVVPCCDSNDIKSKFIMEMDSIMYTMLISVIPYSSIISEPIIFRLGSSTLDVFLLPRCSFYKMLVCTSDLCS